MDTTMSDIKKILDTLSEMATTSGAVATVAAPIGGMKTRAKGSAGVYEQEPVNDEEPKESKDSDDIVNNVKTPSNFGLWQNSYHQAEQQKKNKSKKKVAESRRSEEFSELDDPEIQDIMRRMKKRYEADPRTKDSAKFTADLAKRLRAAEKRNKLDELGNSLMPGGQRSLKLAEENLEEADLIINPFELTKKKSRDIFAKDMRQDHEVSMARSDLMQCIKNSEAILALIQDMQDTDNLQAWVQEKIVKATDYLNTVAEYLEGQMAGVEISQKRLLDQQTGWQNQPTDYNEGYTSGQPAIQREGEDLAWDDPDLVALRKRRPEFRSRTHPELDKPKKSRIKSIKRDGHTEFKGIDREIARQRKLGKLKEDGIDYDEFKKNLSPYKQGKDAYTSHKSINTNPFEPNTKEHRDWIAGFEDAGYDRDEYMDEGASSSYRGKFDSKDEAVKYARERVKSFRDSLDGIEVWSLPGGTYDVVHTMNGSGRDRIVDNGGKKLGTIRPKSEVTEETLDPNLAKAYRMGYEAYKAYKDNTKMAQTVYNKIKQEFPQYAEMWMKGYDDGQRLVKKNMAEAQLDVKTPSLDAVAKKHGVNKQDLLDQLKKGVKVEMEHTTDLKTAKEIALDHLSEFPDYYDKLERVETSESTMTEAEKDACYRKVKSRYKVWPSAYASGALVKCRKVGAKNWGNKSKK